MGFSSFSQSLACDGESIDRNEIQYFHSAHHFLVVWSWHRQYAAHNVYIAYMVHKFRIHWSCNEWALMIMGKPRKFCTHFDTFCILALCAFCDVLNLLTTFCTVLRMLLFHIIRLYCTLNEWYFFIFFYFIVVIRVVSWSWCRVLHDIVVWLNNRDIARDLFGNFMTSLGQQKLNKIVISSKTEENMYGHPPAYRCRSTVRFSCSDPVCLRD